MVMPANLPPELTVIVVPSKVNSWCPPFALFLASMVSLVPLGPPASTVHPSSEIFKCTEVLPWLDEPFDILIVVWELLVDC